MGLHKPAPTGEITEFNGVTAPYEAPDNPNSVIDTAANNMDACIDQLATYIAEKFRRI